MVLGMSRVVGVVEGFVMRRVRYLAANRLDLD